MIALETFEEPTYFGEKINAKLSEGNRLTLAEESVVSREYCRSRSRSRDVTHELLYRRPLEQLLTSSTISTK